MKTRQLLTSSMLGVVLLALSSSSGGQTVESSGRIDPFTTITNTLVSEADLVDAIDQLPRSVTEPAEIWVRIVNGPSFSIRHKKRCAIQLFRRHVRAGMTINQLRSIIGKASFLDQEEIEAITAITGGVPVRMRENATIFVLRLFPEGGARDCAVYFTITGSIKSERLCKFLIRNTHDETVSAAQILEVKAVENYPQNRFNF